MTPEQQKMVDSKLYTRQPESEPPVRSSELLDAAVQRLTDPILRLIQNDPHQWSTRPCTTCQTISQLVNKPFGCDYYRLTKSRRI